VVEHDKLADVVKYFVNYMKV